jgi:hypothetical protein
MSRKPRADSVLKTLPDALQENLFQQLRHNTLEKVQAWLAEKHEVKTSTAALSTFWAWYQSSSLKPAAAFADSLAKQIEKMPELALKAEQATAITQTVFELQAAQDRDPKLFLALGNARLKREKLKLDERKVRILEAKAALADKAQEVADNKSLTEAEQLQRYRQIFGG